MYLKRLELQGFKSFADKTVLDFGQGVTSVVGPNGSGKSNISDAIRWVMGEMSAKSLRGANMQDVIFAGTETRKQVNYAEVSLVLDNSSRMFPIEFDEIVVLFPSRSPIIKLPFIVAPSDIVVRLLINNPVEFDEITVGFSPDLSLIIISP